MPRKLKLDRPGKKSGKNKLEVKEDGMEISGLDELSLVVEAEVNDVEEDADMIINAVVSSLVEAVRAEFLAEHRKWGVELMLYEAHSKAQKQYNAVSFATRMLPAEVQFYACVEVRRQYKLQAHGLGRLNPDCCLICLEGVYVCQCKEPCETCGKHYPLRVHVGLWEPGDCECVIPGVTVPGL